MKTMKKISMLLIAVLITTITVNAQQRGQQGPPQMPDEDQIEKIVDNLTKELSLTDNQKADITEKYTAHFKEVSELMENGRPDREVMEEMKADFIADVNKVLTEDQQKKYEEFLEENESRRPQRPRR